MGVLSVPMEVMGIFVVLSRLSEECLCSFSFIYLIFLFLFFPVDLFNKLTLGKNAPNMYVIKPFNEAKNRLTSSL